MIYFLQDGEAGAVKIGYTKNIASRMQILQTGHVRQLLLLREIDGDKKAEKKLHWHYRERWQRGEWFKFCETMLTVDPDKIEAKPKDLKRPLPTPHEQSASVTFRLPCSKRDLLHQISLERGVTEARVILDALAPLIGATDIIRGRPRKA